MSDTAISDPARQTGPKRLRPAYPFGFAFFCFVLMLYAGIEYIYMRGIPADRITNVNLDLKNLAIWFEGISLAVAAWFIYLGNVASRNQVKGRFWLGVIAYSVIMLVMLFIGLIISDPPAC
jgi:hypothetical protein